MSKVSRIAFILAVAALVSCVDENGGGNGITPEDPTEENTSNLTTVQLASFAGDASRVSYPVTRAEGDETDAEGEVAGDAEDEIKPGTLRLIASIDNPSKDAGFFVPEEGGRYMSATSVYYDEGSETYYVTYHIQGNNYNTTLDTSTAGAIQSFKIDENGDVKLGTGFRAQNPSQEDFDFNHIYFDEVDNRILAVGHNVKDGKQDNTNAIIGVFDPTAGTYTYSTVKTGEKAYDDDGKSLGYKDAGDVNFVMRGSGYYKSGWKFYLVATRKGMAVLRSEPEHLFKPVLNEDGTSYFIPTKGSAKSIAQGDVSSLVHMLYLSEEKKATSDEISSEAKIAHFMINKVPTDLTFGELQIFNSRGSHTPFDPQTNTIEDIEEGDGQTVLPEEIKPIDGKNTLVTTTVSGQNYNEYYAALGTTGLYYHFPGKNSSTIYEGVMKFGNRPVNNVYVDPFGSGESKNDGFLFVANGSKLTVLHRRTMEELDSWNMPSKDADGNDIASSANFIYVTKGAQDENGMYERTVVVAFGQAGVRIFKFTPIAKTEWEHEIK